MGLFDFFKAPKTEQEEYYENYDRQKSANAASNHAFSALENADVFSSGTGFSFTVEDVFTITGRGTVVTGHVASGSVSLNDTVTLKRTNGFSMPVTVTGIEMFRKMLNTAKEGDNVGLLLRGVTKGDIGRGDLLTK